MFKGKRVLAVVPARSGSKGLANKNLKMLDGVSLIGWAGLCLKDIEWIDYKIISTDSQDYINEAGRYGLEAPFTRPRELAADSSSAVDTVAHAIIECENAQKCKFDIVLIIEPTSPARYPQDLLLCVEKLIESDSDSVFTVSELAPKYHPGKILTIINGKIAYYEERGNRVVSRQELEPLYYKNGVCYALTRECIMDKKKIVTENSQAVVIGHDTVNIDDINDFEWAEFLFSKKIIKI